MIATLVGVDHETVVRDLAIDASASMPETIETATSPSAAILLASSGRAAEHEANEHADDEPQRAAISGHEPLHRVRIVLKPPGELVAQRLGRPGRS